MIADCYQDATFICRGSLTYKGEAPSLFRQPELGGRHVDDHSRGPDSSRMLRGGYTPTGEDNDDPDPHGDGDYGLAGVEKGM